MPRGLQLPYTEYVGGSDSPAESFTRDTTEATRVLDVAWDTRLTAVAQILGYSQTDKTDPDAWTLHRYLPEAYPGHEVLIATSLSIQGLGQRGYNTVNGKKIAKYEKARLTVKYEFPEFDVLEDSEVTTEYERFRTFQIKPAAEYLSPPTGAYLQWAEDPSKGKAFPGNVGFIVGVADYSWRWLQVPFDGLPLGQIQTSLGRVNSVEFADCAPGTLLLLAADIQRVNSPFGLRTWTVEYTARYNGRLHNRFYNFEAKKFMQASIDGNYYPPGNVPLDTLLYNEIDFNGLFDVNNANV